MANISETFQPVSQHPWAVLLAGGDGLRLRELTFRIVGDNRPKQFCPIVGPQSLLSQTRSRLSPVFARERQVFVVSRPHQSFYEAELADAEQSIVIAQPVNRGTAVGILIGLIQVMRSDPDAVIGFFPCDHHYSDEETFRSMVRSAVAGAHQFPEYVIILGAEAQYAEIEYGWIEPGVIMSQARAAPFCRVNRFWEKPALPVACELLRRGCLWNTFVTVGRATTFLELLCAEVPEVVLSVTRALSGGDVERTYEELPAVDFSRDILAHHVERLLLLRDSRSGWADLGSPSRVFEILANIDVQPAWLRQIGEAAALRRLAPMDPPSKHELRGSPFGGECRPSDTFDRHDPLE
jgi:mannose-1-phosphate guanylyltransferase